MQSADKVPIYVGPLSISLIQLKYCLLWLHMANATTITLH